jgi:hypothetical protein
MQNRKGVKVMRKTSLGFAIAASAAAIVLSGAWPASAEQATHGHETPVSGVQALSAPLREALSQEMVQLQTGMMTIIPAFISGDWTLIAETAKRMDESYILKQALTSEQLEELHHGLPPEFLELDAEFHYLAGMLSHAAANRKAELAAFYYSRMLESCHTCHAKFALEKFPALARPDDGPAHGHHHH